MFCAKRAKIFKNTFLEKHLRTSASLSSLLGWVKLKKITEIVVKARSSHPRCSMKKAFLKYFAIFTEKHLRWSLLIKFINYKLYILIKFIKKRLPQVFPCEYGITLKAAVLKNICERLLLNGRH